MNGLSRRDFLRHLAIGGAAVGVGFRLPQALPKPRGKIVGSSVTRVLYAGERIRAGSFVVIGDDGRVRAAGFYELPLLARVALHDAQRYEPVTIFIQGATYTEAFSPPNGSVQ